MKKIFFVSVALFFITACDGTDVVYRTTIDSGDADLVNAPVYVDLNETLFNQTESLCVSSGGERLPAQAETVAGTVRVWWLANQRAGESVDYAILANGECPAEEFRWERTDDESLLLSLGNQPVLQYEHPVYDPEDVEQTKKPFHHLFDPAGNERITKGPGGRFSHHRGIFFGYNRVYINDEQIDIWHAQNGERSEHERIIREVEGPVTGGHVVDIHWKDHDGNTFLVEERDLRAFRDSENSFVIDFYSVLTATDGTVRLEGDLHHAGVQFRAAQHVADHSDETHFIRPEGWQELPQDEEMGEEHWLDLPWNAMNFHIEGREYTVVYMSHPSNPDGAEMSERRYGRFGEFFPWHLSPEEPLEIKYRFWVIEGDAPSLNQIQQMFDFYAG